MSDATIRKPRFLKEDGLTGPRGARVQSEHTLQTSPGPGFRLEAFQRDTVEITDYSRTLLDRGEVDRVQDHSLKLTDQRGLRVRGPGGCGLSVGTEQSVEVWDRQGARLRLRGEAGADLDGRLESRGGGALTQSPYLEVDLPGSRLKRQLLETRVSYEQGLSVEKKLVMTPEQFALGGGVSWGGGPGVEFTTPTSLTTQQGSTFSFTPVASAPLGTSVQVQGSCERNNRSGQTEVHANVVLPTPWGGWGLGARLDLAVSDREVVGLAYRAGQLVGGQDTAAQWSRGAQESLNSLPGVLSDPLNLMA